MSLLVKSGMPIAGGLIGAGGEIAWPRPTRPGDVLQVESEILAVTPSRSRPERGMITVKSETRNQKGEVVQILTSKMLVWKIAGFAADHQLAASFPPWRSHERGMSQRGVCGANPRDEGVNKSERSCRTAFRTVRMRESSRSNSRSMRRRASSLISPR